jgi:translation initiation factor SUI1
LQQGIESSFDYKKVLKAFKKEFCCNGTVVEDSELGKVIQLQGDQRKNVHTFLVTVSSLPTNATETVSSLKFPING